MEETSVKLELNIFLRVQPTTNVSQIYLFLQDTLHISDGFSRPSSAAQNWFTTSIPSSLAAGSSIGLTNT